MPDTMSAWDVIDAHTVSDGVADGTFIAAPDDDRIEAGYHMPVAFSRDAWAWVVAWTRDDDTWQDESGRLWDVLMTMRAAAKRAAAKPDGRRYGFEVMRIPNTTPTGRPARAVLPARAHLEIMCQAWDQDGSPCLVVLLPGER